MTSKSKRKRKALKSSIRGRRRGAKVVTSPKINTEGEYYE